MKIGSNEQLIWPSAEAREHQSSSQLHQPESTDPFGGDTFISSAKSQDVGPKCDANLVENKLSAVGLSTVDLDHIQDLLRATRANTFTFSPGEAISKIPEERAASLDSDLVPALGTLLTKSHS